MIDININYKLVDFLESHKPIKTIISGGDAPVQQEIRVTYIRPGDIKK